MSFALEGNAMITKESLQQAQSAINEAKLKIKQLYSASPTTKKIFLVVEGKDDITYYGTRANEYIPEGWSVSIIPARNRKMVVDTYRSLDWTKYSKKTILFFVDRDLSDYTGEDTPVDSNVYITSNYSIENELCTIDTYLKALKYYCDMVDIDEKDEEYLKLFYLSSWTEFAKIADPIMAHILYWKMNGIKSNYSNYKIQGVFEIKNETLQVNPQYAAPNAISQELFRQSGVTYTHLDISPYIALLKAKHSPEEYIRGKFVLAFFVKILIYTIHNSANIIPSKKKAKDTLGLGYENAILRLCGIMSSPDSLVAFFEKMKEDLLRYSG